MIEADMETAMNYLGQELSTTLFKRLHKLPMSLRDLKMLSCGIKALPASLLN